MKLFTPVLLPALIGGLAWLISARLWKGRTLPFRGHWGGAVAFSFGYAAGQWILSRPLYPPATAGHWLFYLTLSTGAIALAEPWWGRRKWTAWPAVFVLAGLSAWLQLRVLFKSTWAALEGSLWLSVLAALTLFTWIFIEKLARARPGASLPWVLWLTASCGSACLVLTGSALLGQFLGGLAAVCGAAVVLSLWSPSFTVERGAITVYVLVLTSLLWQGYFYSELSPASAALILTAPLAAWAGEFSHVKSWPPWRATITRAIAAALPLLTAIGISLAAYLQTASDDYAY